MGSRANILIYVVPSPLAVDSGVGSGVGTGVGVASGTGTRSVSNIRCSCSAQVTSGNLLPLGPWSKGTSYHSPGP